MNHTSEKSAHLNTSIFPAQANASIKTLAIPQADQRVIISQLLLLDGALLLVATLLIATLTRHMASLWTPYSILLLLFNLSIATGFCFGLRYLDFSESRYSLGKAGIMGLGLWIMNISVVGFNAIHASALFVNLGLSALIFTLLSLLSGIAHYEFSKPFHLKKQETVYYHLELRIKRIVDFSASALGLIAVLPILGSVLILLLLEGQGAPLIRQTRIGRDEQRFQMYKLRSMIKNAAQMNIEASRTEKQRVLFKQKNDPRITPVGKIIRKLSLDELPQLLNVLKGEMSLVGPRPPLEHEFELMNWSHKRKFKATPGLTGFWQITGRIKNHRDFNSVSAYDTHYIENWCLMEDFKILLLTIPVVLFQKGAY